MVVLKWRNPMQNIVKQLSGMVEGVAFAGGDTFCWSPSTKTISYKPNLSDKTAIWSLLHETGHAVLKHRDYTSDIQLVMLEVAAWDKAKEIAETIDVMIDENHVQDCIDTYRDWLHQRSTCPRCGLVSLQSSPKSYSCHNCQATWFVTAARFCRPYRLTKADNQKRPPAKQSAQTTTFL